MKAETLLLSVILACCILVGCSGQEESSENETANTKQLSNSIQTIRAEEITLSETLKASGTVAAKQTSNIGTLTSGVVEEIFVRVGDRVEQGQALFKTRAIDFELRLSESQSALEIASAEAVNANAILDRYKGLNDSQAVAQVELDAVRKTASIANATLKLRRAQLNLAEQALKDTVVRAPFSGAVTARYIDEGVYMTNNFSGMGNSAVVQIQECEVAAAILFAPEAALKQLRLGLSGTLWVDGQTDPIASEVAIINDRVDNVHRQVEFRMPFKNPNCVVKAGQSVRAEINTGDRKTLRLPRNVVRGSGSSRHVLLLIDDTVQQQTINTRDVDARFVEVVSGIGSNDEIVVGQSKQINDDDSPESLSQ